MFFLLRSHGIKPTYHCLDCEKQPTPLESRETTGLPQIAGLPPISTVCRFCFIDACFFLAAFVMAIVVWKVVLILFKSNRTPDYEGLNQATRMRALPKHLLTKPMRTKRRLRRCPCSLCIRWLENLTKCPAEAAQVVTVHC